MIGLVGALRTWLETHGGGDLDLSLGVSLSQADIETLRISSGAAPEEVDVWIRRGLIEESGRKMFRGDAADAAPAPAPRVRRSLRAYRARSIAPARAPCARCGERPALALGDGFRKSH